MEQQINKKRTKFVDLAEKRTANAIKAVRLIAHLGNRSAYEYSESDATKIISALQAEVDAVRKKLSATSGRQTEVVFKL